MIDLNTAAATLYGSATPPAAAPAGTDSLVAPEPLQEVTTQQETDPARLMYSPQVQYRDVLPDSAFPTSEDAAAARELVADIGFSLKDIPMLKAAMKMELTPDQRAASRAKAEEMLSRQFGEDADQVLADTRAWIAADPKRVALFNTPAGDDPKVVMRMVELARAAKSRI